MPDLSMLTFPGFTSGWWNVLEWWLWPGRVLCALGWEGGGSRGEGGDWEGAVRGAGEWAAGYCCSPRPLSLSFRTFHSSRRETEALRLKMIIDHWGLIATC